MSKRISQSNIIAKKNVVSALLELIYEKPISMISISELTNRAGVSRMTFYRNYNSIEEIFGKELDEIFQKYELDDVNSVEGIYYDKIHMRHCFTYFYSYRQFLEGLVYCGFGDMFLKKLTGYTYTKWYEIVEQDEEYKLVGFAGFVYSTYMLWKEKNYKESVEEMATYISKVFEK